LFDNEFAYSFTLSKHKIRITQINAVHYELKIDDKSFEQLMIDGIIIYFMFYIITMISYLQIKSTLKIIIPYNLNFYSS